jgi:hypothetical protein
MPKTASERGLLDPRQVGPAIMHAARLHDLAVFQDTIWGEGECDWENEIACWNY